ncbi:MAG: hypothetical protein GY937_04340 [bacterium]|nr:hypothetical protein [bacterium]
MSAARNTAAAVPLAIALLGNALPAGDTAPDNRRFRLAPNATAELAAAAGLNDQQETWLDEHNPFGIPTTQMPGNRTLVIREGHTLAHNNVDLIADWVSFHLKEAYVEGTETRPGTAAFKADPVLRPGRRAERSDYKSSGFDRGHQAAAADQKGRGRRVVRESFLLSNMTPQAPRLNQNRWRLLEDHIQQLAAARGDLWIITGPAFVDDDGNEDGLVEYSVIGKNEVAVPTHYFKIVVAKAASGGHDAMAFLVPNRAVTERVPEEFDAYLVSIDELEELTGFDFLRGLPDPQENSLEGAVAAEVWAIPTD